MCTFFGVRLKVIFVLGCWTNDNKGIIHNILSAQIQSNAAKLSGWRFIMQVDNDPKHIAKATQKFLKVKTWIILQWPSQSPDFLLIEQAFHLLKTKLKAERPTNKKQRKPAAVKAWQSITKEESQSLVMSMSSRLKTVIAFKGFSTKYKKNVYYIYLSNYIWAPENRGTVYKNGCNSQKCCYIFVQTLELKLTACTSTSSWFNLFLFLILIIFWWHENCVSVQIYMELTV